MRSEISIFYQTKETFKALDEKYIDELKFRILVILTMYGVFNSLIGYIRDYILWFPLGFNRFQFIASGLITVLLGGLVAYLISYYVLAFIIYGIGKLLKGSAELIDVRVTLAYCILPFFLTLLYNTYLTIFRHDSFQHSNLVWLEFFVLIITVSFSIKILFIGIKHFNSFGVIKTIINVLPFILIYLFFVTLSLLNNLRML
jgi:hypothetical protein